jgi:hypothetical protein
MEKSERIKVFIKSLLKRSDLMFDHTKLQKLIEYLKLCVDYHKEDNRIDCFLDRLESIKLTSDVAIKPLVDNINEQLDVFLDMLQHNDSLLLLDIAAGLYTVFIKLLDQSVAHSTDAFIQKLSNVSPIGIDYSSKEEAGALHDYMHVGKCVFLAEKKHQFINELMNIPFNDLLKFLKNQKIPYDEERLFHMLKKPTEEFRTYLNGLAEDFGLELEELTLYLHYKNDLDAEECYREELKTYNKVKRGDPRTCTLQDFIQSTPSIPSDILTKEEQAKLERLFSKYCHFVRGYKSLESAKTSVHYSEDETDVVTVNTLTEYILDERQDLNQNIKSVRHLLALCSC